MSNLSYDKLKITGCISFETLCDVSMSIVPNEHGVLKVNGIINEATRDAIMQSQLKNQEISLRELDGKGHEISTPVFSGVIGNVEVSEVNGYFTAKAVAYTGSYLLDMEAKSRSFQDIGMTYKQVIKSVLTDTSRASALFRVGIDTKIGKPVIQYLETDWEFIKRMASHLNAVLIPECTYPLPRFWFGIPEQSGACKFLENEYKTGIEQKYFTMGGLQNPLPKSEYQYYLVKSTEQFQIGSQVHFRNQALRIIEKHADIQDGELIFTYKLGKSGLEKNRKYFNTKINGMSILGTVIKTKSETVKIHLDIDEGQKEATAFDYDWTPPTGNMMYCMPKVGTRVSLYMNNTDEQGAKVVNCIRTNGATCPKTTDSTKRSFTTEHGKQMYLNPDTMGLAGDTTEKGEVESAPHKLILDDNNGITIGSKKTLNFTAGEGIKLQAPFVNIQSKLNFMMAQTGGAISPATLANPSTGLSIFNCKDLIGDTSGMFGTVHVTYAPFDDAPKKGKFDWGKLALGVLAGLAVVAVAAAVVFTGGAALAAVGAIASTTVTSMTVGAAVGGAVAVGFVAVGDYKDGNVSDPKKYVYKGLSGAVSGAVCGYFGPGPGMGFMKYVGLSAKGGALGGLAGTATEWLLNKKDYAYDVKASDFFWNSAFGGLGGALGGALSYGLGANGSKLAKEWCSSKNGAKSFIRNVMGDNIVNGSNATARYIQNLYKVSGAKMGINDLARLVQENPMPLLGKAYTGVQRLVVTNGTRETVASGLAGDQMNKIKEHTQNVLKSKEKLQLIFSEDMSCCLEGW
ncbi:hypothetical protein [Anaeromicropila populeti]|uniref:Phage late control gene D protein (GPD) n=1 Tax=Anaeromicropila populeti TaxID=37658 RepID=A0A1I6KCN9_9FIRM|nr:hypothetical protein [Anaeromicropila populeti]SFR88977.1 Phage late control gene D protein (GPD) [Anaeromicropila populeti]